MAARLSDFSDSSIRFVIASHLRDLVRTSSIDQTRLARHVGLSEAVFSRVLKGQVFGARVRERIERLRDVFDGLGHATETVVLTGRLDVPARPSSHEECDIYLELRPNGRFGWSCYSHRVWLDAYLPFIAQRLRALPEQMRGDDNGLNSTRNHDAESEVRQSPPSAVRPSQTTSRAESAEPSGEPR